MKTKIVKCMKCKCEFESEVDECGIPYNKLCKKHRKMTENESYTETIRDINKLYYKNKRIRSKKDYHTIYEPSVDSWISYNSNPFINWDKREICRDKDEDTCINMKKLILAIDKTIKV